MNTRDKAKEIAQVISTFPKVFKLTNNPGRMFMVAAEDSHYNDKDTLLLRVKVYEFGYWCPYAMDSEESIRAKMYQEQRVDCWECHENPCVCQLESTWNKTKTGGRS